MQISGETSAPRHTLGCVAAKSQELRIHDFGREKGFNLNGSGLNDHQNDPEMSR
jgi:hypothetical protein